MKYIFTLALATISFLILGCKESYPSIFMEEEPVPDVIHAENDEDGRVPITPTMTEPQYEILTRGTGAFGNFDVDSDHWLSAKFHTYALLGSNIFSNSDAQGFVDYTRNDNDHRLLWDQRMKITDGSLNVHFFDESDNLVTRYYSWQRQNWKYNFFTYYADDLDLNGKEIVSAKDIKVSFDIDGTQDIMHAVAYHTNKQFDDAVKDLNEEEDKPIHQYKDELLYSTMAGHRGLNPIFNINHLLTRLDFMIKGAKPANASSSDNMPDSYRKIVVRKVTVTVPNHATLTIADEKWSDSTVYKTDLQNNNVITFSGTPQELPIIMNREPVENYYKWILEDDKYKENPYKEEDAQFHITSTKISALGKPIMLPSSDMFVVTLYSDMLDVSASSTEDDGFLVNKIKSLDPIHYNVRYSNGAFEAGHAYTVIISVYGVQNIEGTLTLNAWIGRDAGDFVGKEQGEYNPNGDHVVSVGGDDEEDNGKK